MLNSIVACVENILSHFTPSYAIISHDIPITILYGNIWKYPMKFHDATYVLFSISEFVIIYREASFPRFSKILGCIFYKVPNYIQIYRYIDIYIYICN